MFVCGSYLPHVTVVVVGLDLAGVDLLALERTEPRSALDARSLAEDADVMQTGHVSTAQLQTCHTSLICMLTNKFSASFYMYMYVHHSRGYITYMPYVHEDE